MSDITKIVLFAVELGGTMIGNIFLLVLIWRSKQLHRSASHNIMFNCGVSDLMNVIINVPLAMDYMVFKTETLAPIFINFAFTFLMLLTLHSTLIMMADRLVIVKYPTMYKNMITVKLVRRAIALMWLSTFAVAATLSAYSILRKQPKPKDNSKGDIQQLYRPGGKTFVFLTTTAIFTAVAFLSGKLYRELQKLHKIKPDVSSTNNVEHSKGKAKRRKIVQSSRTVILVMIIYLVCYFPSVAQTFFQISKIELSIDNDTREFVMLFCAKMSSFFNPIVYILRSTIMKQALVKLFTNRPS